MSWKGQYMQCDKWHDMSFQQLNIDLKAGGLISGRGNDAAGNFEISGSFAYAEPICRWVKSYDHHKIYYEGTLNNSTKEIKGKWGFQPGDKDGEFKLWQ